VIEAETCCHLVKINIPNTSCVLTCESLFLTSIRPTSMTHSLLYKQNSSPISPCAKKKNYMRDSVVGTVTTPKLGPTQLSRYRALLAWAQSSQEIKLNSHPQSCAEVKNEWRYTLTPQNTSMPCTLVTSSDNLCFPLGLGFLRK